MECIGRIGASYGVCGQDRSKLWSVCADPAVYEFRRKTDYFRRLKAKRHGNERGGGVSTCRGE